MLSFMNFLTGGAFAAILKVVTNVTGAIANTKSSEVQADAQVNLAQANAQVEMAKQVALMTLADKGWWVTAWMKPAAFYICLFHFGAIILDRGFHMGWKVAVVPEYAAMEHDIILLSIGIVGLKGAIRLFTK